MKQTLTINLLLLLLISEIWGKSAAIQGLHSAENSAELQILGRILKLNLKFFYFFFFIIVLDNICC